MKPDRDPPRLDESDEPLVRRAIGAARRDLPDDERMSRLSAGLMARIGGGGGGDAPPDAGPPPPAAPPVAPAAPTGATAAGSSAATAKATGLALALALAGGGVWYASSGPEAQPAPATFDDGRREQPVDTAAAIAPAPPSASAGEAPPAAASAEVPTVAFDALPSATAAQASASPSSSAAASASASAEPGGPSDMDLLRQAQDALSGDPARALSLSAKHQQAFPRSSFAQEREVIAINALVRLGRRADAEARADRFAQSWPSSGHRRRIDSLLGR